MGIFGPSIAKKRFDFSEEEEIILEKAGISVKDVNGGKLGSLGETESRLKELGLWKEADLFER